MHSSKIFKTFDLAMRIRHNNFKCRCWYMVVELLNATTCIDGQLRILMIVESFYPYISGVARRFGEVIKGLAKKGHKVLLITGNSESLHWRSDDPDIQQNVQIKILPSVNVGKRIHNDLCLITPDVCQLCFLKLLQSVMILYI
ncbi:hypothetical protein GJ496_009603 [Pomphorhynchus laevis]|nr:hypothetical protein GJ496_009603 [Pomphorhynchus laevis]